MLSSKYEVSLATFEAHLIGKRLVKARPDVNWCGDNALVWELDDGSVVGFEVTAGGGCPTCGPSTDTTYYIVPAGTK